MKRNVIKIICIAALIMALLSVELIFGGEKAPDEVIKLADELASLGKDTVIIKAVKKQNSQGLTLAQIKVHDEKWKNTPGIVDYMAKLMNSDCGKYLKKIQKKYGYLSEIFVTDNQGANVAMTDKTSDYWQGDEDKFIKTFNKGKGKVFIDDIEFDDSAQAYLVQISVPVLDKGRTIGVITFGINVDEI